MQKQKPLEYIKISTLPLSEQLYQKYINNSNCTHQPFFLLPLDKLHSLNVEKALMYVHNSEIMFDICYNTIDDKDYISLEKFMLAYIKSPEIYCIYHLSSLWVSALTLYCHIDNEMINKNECAFLEWFIKRNKSIIEELLDAIHAMALLIENKISEHIDKDFNAPAYKETTYQYINHNFVSLNQIAPFWRIIPYTTTYRKNNKMFKEFYNDFVDGYKLPYYMLNFMNPLSILYRSALKYNKVNNNEDFSK